MTETNISGLFMSGTGIDRGNDRQCRVGLFKNSTENDSIHHWIAALSQAIQPIADPIPKREHILSEAMDVEDNSNPSFNKPSPTLPANDIDCLQYLGVLPVHSMAMADGGIPAESKDRGEASVQPDVSKEKDNQIGQTDQRLQPKGYSVGLSTAAAAAPESFGSGVDPSSGDAMREVQTSANDSAANEGKKNSDRSADSFLASKQIAPLATSVTGRNPNSMFDETSRQTCPDDSDLQFVMGSQTLHSNKMPKGPDLEIAIANERTPSSSSAGDGLVLQAMNQTEPAVGSGEPVLKARTTLVQPDAGLRIMVRDDDVRQHEDGNESVQGIERSADGDVSPRFSQLKTPMGESADPAIESTPTNNAVVLPRIRSIQSDFVAAQPRRLKTIRGLTNVFDEDGSIQPSRSATSTEGLFASMEGISRVEEGAVSNISVGNMISPEKDLTRQPLGMTGGPKRSTNGSIGSTEVSLPSDSAILPVDEAVDGSPSGFDRKSLSEDFQSEEDVTRGKFVRQEPDSIGFEHPLSAESERSEKVLSNAGVKHVKSIENPMHIESIRSVIESAARNRREGTSEVRIRLQPESLGVVTMRVQIEEGKLQVHIATEQPTARDMIEAQMPSLRSELEQKGLVVEKIHVEVSGGRTHGHTDNGMNQRGSHQEPQQNGRLFVWEPEEPSVVEKNDGSYRTILEANPKGRLSAFA